MTEEEPDDDEALKAAGTALGCRLRRVELLPGGWQHGAWLVVDDADDTTRYVLKVHGDEQSRVLAAERRIASARAAGWPVPAWVATGRLDDDRVWVVQQHIDGRRPELFDRRVVEGIVEAFEYQRGLGRGRPAWGTWAVGVVADGWEDFRGRVLAHFPGGAALVELVDRIAAATTGTRLRESDLVHGDTSVGNFVEDSDGRIWLVDCHSAGDGPIEYDVVNCLLSLAAFEDSAPGAEVLWEWAGDELDPAAVAVCAGSAALTMAEAFHRLGHDDKAPAVVPGVLAVVERAAQLVT